MPASADSGAVTSTYNAGTGVFASVSTATVYDSFVFNNGGGDVFTPSGVAGRSHIGSAFGMPQTAIIGAPQFTRYGSLLPGDHAQLPNQELWDLHLRFGSPGRGEGDQGEDVGPYQKDDPYYDDAGSDGIPDGWARMWFGISSVSPTADPDGDGLTNLAEYKRGTCPITVDTDQDSVNDDLDNIGPLNPNVP